MQFCFVSLPKAICLPRLRRLLENVSRVHSALGRGKNAFAIPVEVSLRACLVWDRMDYIRTISSSKYGMILVSCLVA